MHHTTEILSTTQIKAAKRSSFWRDLVCDTFVELECQNMDETDFFGHLSKKRISESTFSCVHAARQRVLRTKQKISKSNDDSVLISFQRRGSCFIQQDDKSTSLHPGHFAIYDTTRPYELNFEEEFEQWVLQIPRQQLASRINHIEFYVARSVSAEVSLGNIALDLLRETQMNGVPEALQGRSLDIFLDLLALSMTAQYSDQLPNLTNSGNLQLIRLKKFIEENLKDNSLSVKSVADAHRCSTRHVNALFAASGTTASSWLWEKRLEACRKDLSSPALNSLSLSSIAYKWGFSDLSHFSRRFKSRFQTSPSAYRKSSQLS